MSFLLAALLLSADQPTVQQQQPQAPAAAPASPVAPAPKKMAQKKICRVQQSDVGSRMTRSLCLTAQEWQLRDNGVNMSGRAGSSSVSEEQ